MLTFEQITQMLQHCRDSKLTADASAATVRTKQAAADQAQRELAAAMAQAGSDSKQLDLDRRVFEAAADSFLQVAKDDPPTPAPAPDPVVAPPAAPVTP